MSTTNNYFSDLSAVLSRRFSKDSLEMSMTDWLEANTTIKGRPFTVSQHKYQRAIIDDMHPALECIKPSQVGLALDCETPIPTPSGWVKMGDIKIGDRVYDEQGSPCNVTYVSPIHEDHRCYEITFNDGTSIVADEQHRWYVESMTRAFNADGLYESGPRKPYGHSGVVNTRMLADNYRANGKNLFRIPNTRPLQGESTNLLIDPYLLGVWLGDGSRSSASVTCHEGGVLDIPHEVVANNNGTLTLRIPGLHAQLRQEGLINNKHIPQKYLRASYEDRMALLQGLMDTDGSITKRGRASFYNTDPQLISDVQELLASLGYKYRTRWRSPSSGTLKSGYVIQGKKDIAEISFVSYVPVFRMKRKADRTPPRRRPYDTEYRHIVKVEEVKTRPTKCITVDSPTHLYLAGKQMVPTHNTEGQLRKSLAILARYQGRSLIFTLPTQDMYERISNTRAKPIVDSDQVFNPPTNGKVVRRTDLIQIGKSYLYLVPAIETAATSIDADVVMNDEVDLSDQKMLQLFNSRLQGSDMRVKQRFSTPTFPNFGIDLSFQSTDQRHLLVQCKSCNHWNDPEFSHKFIHLPGLAVDLEHLYDLENSHLDHVDIPNTYVKCEKCDSRLDLDDYDRREWVAKHPNRILSRGYKLTPFCTSRLDPAYILQQLVAYKRDNFLRGWFNTVLGLPYSDGSIQIGYDLIQAAFSEQVLTPDVGDAPVWIGIDVGQTCHLVLGRGSGSDDMNIFHFEAIPARELVDRVAELRRKYNVVGGLIDREPYTPTAEAIRDASDGRIMPADYALRGALDIVADKFGNWDWVKLPRTAALDYVKTRLSRKDITFAGYGIYKEVITEHLRDMVRNEEPGKPATWVKLNNNDHFFHALALVLAAPEALQLRRHKDKEDRRSSLFIGGISISQKPMGGIVGFTDGIKSVDKFIQTRILN